MLDINFKCFDPSILNVYKTGREKYLKKPNKNPITFREKKTKSFVLIKHGKFQ